jgi:hypothetical protein
LKCYDGNIIFVLWSDIHGFSSPIKYRLSQRPSGSLYGVG